MRILALTAHAYSPAAHALPTGVFTRFLIQVDEEVRARENEAGCLAQREFDVKGRLDGLPTGKWGYQHAK